MNLIYATLTGLMLTAGPLGHIKENPDPVKWNFRVEKAGAKTYVVHCTATIEDSWHIYAQIQPPSAISEPTKIVFIKSPLFSLSGKVEEKGHPKKQIIEEAGIEQNTYEKTVDFTQEVIIKNPTAKLNITGTITYQACTDEMCLPPGTLPFSVPLPNP